MTRPTWIEVGRVARPHGVRGEVRIISSSDNPDRFAEGSVMYARPPEVGVSHSGSEKRTRLTVAAVRGSAVAPIVAFRETGSRKAAESLRAHILEVEATELPRLGEDEFYPFDLEGLVVRDEDGKVIGRVSEVVDSPAHGLLSVALESGGRVLVPFVSAAVPLVASERGFLVVDSAFLEGSGKSL
jgi:16S rRNA processing protein RimM